MESFYSRSWHRVASLRPRLKEHVTIARHLYQGALWHVIDDRLSGKSFRFTPGAWAVIKQMDGIATVDEIWTRIELEAPEETPTQDEIVHLIGQLYQADALESDRIPDLDELNFRAKKQARRERVMQFLNPMAVRIPLIDPDRFLDKTINIVAPIFSRAGFAIWLALIIAGLVSLAANWTELTNNLSDRVLAPNNLVILAVLYPLVKFLHELGHGYAVKRWGGEVHTIGLMFLVFMPVPYVDASAANAFSGKWSRVVVGAGGMMVELALAAIAMMIWAELEPGVLRAILFNVMVIAGVSTIMFNGNPLLKFDGYYILVDLVGMPNLAQRATAQLGYMVRRHVLRIWQEENPAASNREGWWLCFYAVASFCYRIFVSLTIIAFVSAQFFFFGVILAAWVIALMLIFPFSKMIYNALRGPQLMAYRGRVWATLLGGAGLIYLGLFIVPMPYATIIQGLVWADDEAIIRAKSNGRVADIYVTHGQQVKAGDLIARLENVGLTGEVRRLSGRKLELETAQRAALSLDRTQAQLVSQELGFINDDLAYQQDRHNGLMIKAPREGTIIFPGRQQLGGVNFVEGEVIAYLFGEDDPLRVRAVVPEKAVEITSLRTAVPQVRFSESIMTPILAVIERIEPAASRNLPGAALASVYGGQVPINPHDQDALEPLEPHFQIDLLVDRQPLAGRAGGRAFVRLGHAAEPVGYRLMRYMRLTLLSRFGV